MEQQISLPKELAQALYSRLLIPVKDSDGHTVYVISLTLASDLRMAIGDAVQ